MASCFFLALCYFCSSLFMDAEKEFLFQLGSPSTLTDLTTWSFIIPQPLTSLNRCINSFIHSFISLSSLSYDDWWGRRLLSVRPLADSPIWHMANLLKEKRILYLYERFSTCCCVNLGITLNCSCSFTAYTLFSSTPGQWFFMLMTNYWTQFELNC